MKDDCMNNRWLFIGNDERFRICQQLAEVEGKKAVLVPETTCIEELEEMIEQFQPGQIVFPIRPLAVRPNPQVIPENATLYVGGGDAAVRDEYRQTMHCYLKDEGFLVANAKLTAEAWVHHFYTTCHSAIYKKEFIVAGFGRVGKAVAARLQQNEAEVRVLSADPTERQAAKEAGYDVAPLTSSVDMVDAYVINTIPIQWYTPEKTLPLRLFDLASFPHCLTDATRFEYDTVLPTLPGKHFPIDAAKILYRTLRRLA